jgi:hypothetical protein|tara:strand:+ start:334 stop:492 length:159 start_codon:yes stop_codon:yes gene_type:complete
MATVQITSHISAQGILVDRKGDLAWVNVGGGRIVCGRFLGPKKTAPNLRVVS